MVNTAISIEEAKSILKTNYCKKEFDIAFSYNIDIMETSLFEFWKSPEINASLNHIILPLNSPKSKDNIVNKWQGHSDFIGGMVSTDKLLMTSSEDGFIQFWTHEGVKVEEANLEAPINHLALSPDNTKLAACSDDECLYIFNIEDQKVLQYFEHENYVSSAVFITNNVVASTSRDKTVCIWDLENNKQVAKFDQHQDWVYAIAKHPQKKIVLSSSTNFSLIAWDIDKLAVEKQIVGGSSVFYAGTLSVGENESEIGNKESINKILWINDSQVCTIASEVVLWNDQTWELIWKTDELNEEIHDAVVDSEKNILITVSNTIDGWDLKNGRHLFSKVTSEKVPIHSCTLQNGILFTGDEEGEITTWNINDLFNKKSEIEHSDFIYNFELINDNIITTSFDKTSIIWTKEGQALKRIKGVGASPKIGDVNPIHPHQVSICSEGKFQVVDLNTQKIIHKIKFDKKDLEVTGCCWLSETTLIAYGYCHPRWIDLTSKEIKILHVPYSFISHEQIDDSQVIFTTYRGNRGKIDKDSPCEIVDVGAEIIEKDMRNFTPFVIFDTQKCKVIHELWGTKLYPKTVLKYSENEALVQYNDVGDDILKWNLSTGDSSVYMGTQDIDLSMTPFEENGVWHFIPYKSAIVQTIDPISGQRKTWTFPHESKSNMARMRNGDIYYVSEDKFYVFSWKEKKTIVELNDGEKVRQADILDNKLLIKTSTGQLLVFEYLVK